MLPLILHRQNKRSHATAEQLQRLGASSVVGWLEAANWAGLVLGRIRGVMARCRVERFGDRACVAVFARLD